MQKKMQSNATDLEVQSENLEMMTNQSDVQVSKDVEVSPQDVLNFDEVDVSKTINVIKKKQLLANEIKKMLKEGVDYGTAPYQPKPSLYSSGASLLMMIYNLDCEYEIEEKTISHKDSFYSYTIKGRLYQRETGMTVMSAFASCSTNEKGKGGIPQNTVLQIAQKRAMVRCVRIALHLDGEFTQDMNDEKEYAVLMKDALIHKGIGIDKQKALIDEYKASKNKVALGSSFGKK